MKKKDLDQYRANVKKKRFENKRFYDNSQKKRPKLIDQHINDLDEEIFAKTDCQDCANCCKGSPAILVRRDIVRISKDLGMKPGEFTDEYLTLDKNDDYVFAQTPCRFLNDDNSCNIYDIRPASCADFPYTDQRKVSLAVMHENVAVCPVVYEITERIKRIYIEELKIKMKKG